MVLFGLLGGLFGVLFLIAGVFLVFFFPGTTEHQTEHFSLVGVVLGFIFLLVAGALLFL